MNHFQKVFIALRRPGWRWATIAYKNVENFLRFFGPSLPLPLVVVCEWKSVNNREKLTLKLLKSKDLSFQCLYAFAFHDIERNIGNEYGDLE